MTQSTAGLADTIESLRRELSTAMRNRPETGIVFELGEAEVELQLAVTKEAGGDAGVRLGVVSFGAKGGLASEATHRVLLSLSPMMWEAETATAARKLVAARVHDWVEQEPV